MPAIMAKRNPIRKGVTKGLKTKNASSAPSGSESPDKRV